MGAWWIESAFTSDWTCPLNALEELAETLGVEIESITIGRNPFYRIRFQSLWLYGAEGETSEPIILQHRDPSQTSLNSLYFAILGEEYVGIFSKAWGSFVSQTGGVARFLVQEQCGGIYKRYFLEAGESSRIPFN